MPDVVTIPGIPDISLLQLEVESLPAGMAIVNLSEEELSERKNTASSPTPGSGKAAKAELNYELLRERVNASKPSEALQQLAHKYNLAYYSSSPNKPYKLCPDDIEDFAAETAPVWAGHMEAIRNAKYESAFHELPTELITFAAALHPEATRERLIGEGYGHYFPGALSQEASKALPAILLLRCEISDPLGFSETMLEHAQIYTALWKNFRELKLSSQLCSLLKHTEATIRYAQRVTADQSFHTQLRERAVEDIAALFTERYLRLENYYSANLYSLGSDLNELDTYYFDQINIIEQNHTVRDWVFAGPRVYRRMEALKEILSAITRTRIEQKFPDTAEESFKIVEDARARAHFRLTRARIAKSFMSGSTIADLSATLAQYMAGAPIKFW